ncbi:MAG: hypothetical protein ACHQX3_00025 [Nitrospirales bacterium]|jgi:hypothetical protein
MSLKLKSLTQAPPNGFYYRQAESGWELSNWDFELLCQELQKHRRANPKFRLTLDMDSIRNEVNSVNAARVAEIPGAMIYLTEGDLPPPKFLPQRNLGQRLKNVAIGAKANFDWLTSGAKAVAPELSESRASVCVSCPNNNSKDFTAFFTMPISIAIRKAVNRFKELKLTTSHDELLGVCDACLCPMRLKVHMEIEEIVKQMPSDSRARLWENCWVTKEAK